MAVQRAQDEAAKKWLEAAARGRPPWAPREDERRPPWGVVVVVILVVVLIGVVIVVGVMAA
jgi:hypothetical protein